MSEPILLYGGQVRLSFDEKAHSYSVSDDAVDEGEPFLVSSVTTILDGALAKPALIGWAAKTVAESIAKDWKPGIAYDEIQIAEAIRRAKQARFSISRGATDIGKLAHDWIERFIRNEAPELPVNEAAKNCCRAAVDWMAEHKFRSAGPERKIYSRKYKYPGTMDWPCYVDDAFSVVDWKSSKNIYPEMPLQLAAYQQGYEEETGDKVHYRYVVRLGKVDGAFEVRRFGRSMFKRDLKAFLAAKTIYERVRELDEHLNPNRRKSEKDS